MRTLIIGLAIAAVSTAAASEPATPGGKPVDAFAAMLGVWEGRATGVGPDGKRYDIRQTERVGAMLGGDIVVVEGRGTDAAGALVFNAVGIISWNAQAGRHDFRSYAQGRAGTFAMTRTATGYIWETPAGPGATMRYEAIFKGDTWTQTGRYMREGAPPAEVFSMTLKRVGDTDWPAAGAPR